MATKELASIFKALSLHVDDEKLKDWADEADEEGMPACAWTSTRGCDFGRAFATRLQHSFTQNMEVQ